MERSVIELRDVVFIRTSRGQVWRWLEALPDHYREWHPGHIRCWYERGRGLETGAVLGIVEELHGRVHRLTLRTTEIAPTRLLRYSGHGVRGGFQLEDADGGTLVTATLAFGVDVPVIGRLVDRVLGWMLSRRLAAVRTHMHEEGLNLKRILEREQPRVMRE